MLKSMEVYDPNQRPIIIREQSRTNGMGIAGFVISLITIFLGWIPVFGWILWALGMLFSVIGVFRRPRGLAIAGLILSIVGLVFIVFVYALLAAALGIDTSYLMMT